MRKNKILCIMQLPPPVHGASVMNEVVAYSKLLNECFEIDILATNYVKEVKDIGHKNFKKIFLLFKYLFQLIYKLIFNRPDLVYFTIVPYSSSFLRDALFVVIIKLFKVKLVYHLHGKGAKQYYNKYKVVYDFVYKNVSVICLSEKLINDIPFYKRKPFIVHNGIPKIEYTSLMKPSEKDGIVRVLYLSNFFKDKGVLLLLDAVKKIIQTVQNIEVILIGQYSKEISEEFLKKYIHDNKLENYITVKGPVYGEAKQRYFLTADVFVFPTFYKNEAFPLVLLEAMQYGLPIVSTTEGGIPDEVVNNETGLLVDPQNVNDLVESLYVLIKNKDMRQQMGTNGKERYNQKFTVDIFEENLKKVFLTILKNK